MSIATDPKADIAGRILDELSQTVLKVGELLDEVFETYPDFESWVLAEVPLQPHTAERIRAMFLVHRDKRGHPDLPDAWKALWSMG